MIIKLRSIFFENGNERDIIERFRNFLDDHQEKTFVHWSMNSPSFGFNPIQNRYKELTGKNISITPRLQIDLSEYLKEKYGIEYISRQGVRFNNLAKLNGFSGIKLDLEVKNTVRRNSKIRISILNIPSRKTWSVKDFRLKL